MCDGKCCWCSMVNTLHCHQSWGYHVNWERIEEDLMAYGDSR